MERSTGNTFNIFGFKQISTFFLRTVPDIADYILPIEETLRSRFITGIAGSFICSDTEERYLHFQ